MVLSLGLLVALFCVAFAVIEGMPSAGIGTTGGNARLQVAIVRLSLLAAPLAFATAFCSALILVPDPSPTRARRRARGLLVWYVGFEASLLVGLLFIASLYPDRGWRVPPDGMAYVDPSDYPTVSFVTERTPLFLKPFCMPILWMVDNSMGLTPILLFSALWGLGLTLAGYAAWYLCGIPWRRKQRDG